MRDVIFILLNVFLELFDLLLNLFLVPNLLRTPVYFIVYIF